MTRALLAAIVLILIAGIAAAEPQPVDGGWQRSDEAPEPTPTAPPPEETPAPTAAPPETAFNASVDGHSTPKVSLAGWTVWSLYAWLLAAGVGGLLVLALWLRGDAR